ncbi:ubiquitin-like-conjugating enzyme ATG10 [Ceratitis capitata]|uniref:Ubiquitin-like-conjugating enzyme ATG10 n=1 Tax=Ceratitis capitata TaxID=7213 RepID=A0A811VIB2_CERCA|nr:ubiquitin-like-conjugating enzyme ATG10 [Ceratitis capitata]CAD7014734.1 unnamed protein product [Ceratitis capitata]
MANTVNMSWEEFLQEAEEFKNISDRLGDSWTLCKKGDDACNTYLVYEQKILSTVDLKPTSDPFEESKYCTEDITAASGPNNDLLKTEYHVIYSLPYQVPVLYFRLYRSDGSLVSIEDAWRIFRGYGGNASTTLSPHQRTNDDMLNIMTQLEHPVLRKPYYALHPCRTAELLANTGRSRNRILTFISLMGPYVQLTLRNEYGMEYAE